MNALWTGYPTTDTINFPMKYRLSMITINYDFATEFTDATINGVYIKSFIVSQKCLKRERFFIS